MLKNRFKQIVVLLLTSTVADARDLSDRTGVLVHLVDSPKRIVTLAPSLGELASDVAGDELSRIVGVSEYTNYPVALKKIASIGPYAHINIERVAGLKPDLVLATLDGNAKDEVLHLREIGLPVVVVGGETFTEVEDSIKMVAQAMGNEKTGVMIAKQFREGLERIRKRGYERKKAPGFMPKTVLLQLGDDPMVVAGGKSFLNGALDVIGAVNAYGDSSVHYPRPSLEDIVQRDPDVIVVLPLGSDLAQFWGYALRWKRFPFMKAVKGNRVRTLQGDSILRPTLRLLEGLSLLDKVVYGPN